MHRKQKISIFLLILLISDLSLSFASKLDKKHDKHKSVNHSKTENQPAKTTNSPHSHSNHTSHANKTDVNHHDEASTPSAQTHLPIGWSLDKEQSQQHHNNPNGYAVHHHEQQNHQQIGGHPQPGHQQVDGHHAPNQVGQQPAQPQASGGMGSALAAGAGGLALGAGGGLLISHLLNSDKSGEKVEETTVSPTTIEATTEPTKAVGSTAQVLKVEVTEIETTLSVSEVTTVEPETSTTTSETQSESTTESSSQKPDEVVEPIVLAAGLIPAVQSAKIPSESTQGIESVSDVTTPTATTKSNSSMIRSSIKFALFVLAFQLLLNYN